jgi:hypothetical protein
MTPRRIHSATAMSVRLSRNGTRHPQARNCCSLIDCVHTRKTTLARMTPAGTPICGAEP